MPTTREVTAAKAERDRREQRYFYPEHLGAKCVGGCGLAVPLALIAIGMHAHPTCGKDWPSLVAAAGIPDSQDAATPPPLR